MPLLAKSVVVILLLVIVGSLGSGLLFLIKDKGHSERTARALTVRIALSLLLFALLILGYATGYIHPHGVYPRSPAATQGTTDTAPSPH
ncbi:MAG: twin transmembrane helix small protein [Gammaproteobacteria bacterium]